MIARSGVMPVSMVIGLDPYTLIAVDHRKPVVISGFKPIDIIKSI
jgi:hydrogenase expression/formation protein HypD